MSRVGLNQSGVFMGLSCLTAEPPLADPYELVVRQGRFLVAPGILLSLLSAPNSLLRQPLFSGMNQLSGSFGDAPSSAPKSALPPLPYILLLLPFEDNRNVSIEIEFSDPVRVSRLPPGSH